jgi:hypothetical protein
LQVATPIGNGYPDFPWVIFKSYDLTQIRRSLFKANYGSWQLLILLAKYCLT